MVAMVYVIVYDYKNLRNCVFKWVNFIVSKYYFKSSREVEKVKKR